MQKISDEEDDEKEVEEISDEKEVKKDDEKELEETFDVEDNKDKEADEKEAEEIKDKEDGKDKEADEENSEEQAEMDKGCSGVVEKVSGSKNDMEKLMEGLESLTKMVVDGFKGMDERFKNMEDNIKKLGWEAAMKKKLDEESRAREMVLAKKERYIREIR